MDREWSAAALLSSGRGLIFRAIKEPVILSALANTAFNDGGQFNLNLSRSKVRKPLQIMRVVHTLASKKQNGFDERLEMRLTLNTTNPVISLTLKPTARDMSRKIIT